MYSVVKLIKFKKAPKRKKCFEILFGFAIPHSIPYAIPQSHSAFYIHRVVNNKRANHAVICLCHTYRDDFDTRNSKLVKVEQCRNKILKSQN